MKGHTKGVNWVAFHPTMPMIGSGGDDNAVRGGWRRAAVMGVHKSLLAVTGVGLVVCIADRAVEVREPDAGPAHGQRYSQKQRERGRVR